MTDGERAAKAAPGEDRENIRAAKLEESQSGCTAIGPEPIDLLAFNSVAEMQLLGLEKLMCAPIAMGGSVGAVCRSGHETPLPQGTGRGAKGPSSTCQTLEGKKK